MDFKDSLEPKIQEKCAVVGVYSAEKNTAFITRRALAMLQHRGQESTGITVWKNKKFLAHVGMGLVQNVITDTALKKLDKSIVAIGHNRYSTTGGSFIANAHPLTLFHKTFSLSIAHNGNIPDLTYLKKHIKKIPEGASDTDTTLIAQLLLEQRTNYKSWEETLAQVLSHVEGAFSLTILTEDGSLFGVRDPWGIRPLVLGKLPKGWIIASETVATDGVKAEYVRDIKNGEIIKISTDGTINSYFFGSPKRQKFCIFEHIYFSRPDSFINGTRIRKGREESGIRLGIRLKKKNIQADVVVPIFDSGYPAAKGVAHSMGLPLIEAITTSHFIGRTFIRPGQEKRETAVGDKHTVIPDGILGKKVVFVDDSAVRLTTSTKLVKALKEAGAKEVYAAFASPPIVHHCDLGIDLKSKDELPAAKWANQPLEVIEKNVANLIDADKAVYLPIEETASAMGGTTNDFYYTPFGGPHPVKGKQEVFKKRKKQNLGKPKICVFASIFSKGGNLENVIQKIENGRMNAQIIEVLSNREESYSLVRAKKHKIATSVIPFAGKIKDQKARKAYEKKLIEHIEKLMPDIILLSGWSIVFSDYFLKKMQQLQIIVINHHPALLSEDASDVVMTSRGPIPVIRGNHKFSASYETDIPVAGLTVHQVIPGKMYDVGPIIMKTEVRKKQGESLEEWENRNREMEYTLVPAAINRVINVLLHNIDVSKGDFPW